MLDSVRWCRKDSQLSIRYDGVPVSSDTKALIDAKQHCIADWPVVVIAAASSAHARFLNAVQASWQSQHLDRQP